MTMQDGSKLIAKLEDHDSPGSFLDIGGFQQTSLTLSGSKREITSGSSGGYRELMDCGGIAEMGISGSGLFDSDKALHLVRGLLIDRRLARWQLDVPGLGIVEGDFMVMTLTVTGSVTGEVTYSLSLESSLEFTLTAA